MTDVPDILDGIGAHRPGDRRGLLIFEYLPDELQRKEDSRLAADHDAQHWLYHFSERPATETERILLQHLGYELPDELVTRVFFESFTVRRRTWPQLEGEEP